MIKTNRSIARNQSYRKSEFSIRERHNERLNESYYNSDVIQDRQPYNVYFKRCDGGYAETVEKMLADGTVSIKNLKTDGSAKVFDELVFDVNTEYFERGGGYEYAKSIFEEAYRLIVKQWRTINNFVNNAHQRTQQALVEYCIYNIHTYLFFTGKKCTIVILYVVWVRKKIITKITVW